jgi:hypothetical protein
MEMTNELMAQLAMEEVTDLQIGVGYSNRIIMITESGHAITADLVQILSPEERLAEAERILSLKSEELAEAQAKKEAIELELAKIQGPEPLEGV